MKADALFQAWQAASKTFPLATRYHWHHWDYMWHVETCSGYDPETSGLNYCKRFHSVLDFIDRECDFDELLENVRRDVILVGGKPD